MSENSTAFKERITVIPGATDDREVIKRAVAGCDAVLTVLVPRGVHGYASRTAQAVLDYAQPGARLVFSCGWHITRDGQDVYSRQLKMIVNVFGPLARLARFADLDDQVEACRRVFASDTRWTVVRGSDLEEGESQGLAGVEPARGRPHPGEQPHAPDRFRPVHGGGNRERRPGPGGPGDRRLPDALGARVFRARGGIELNGIEQINSGPMAGRTVLVTGATGGIGKATALGLAALGAHLAITGRDRARTEDAAREIRAAGGGQVDVFVADLSSQSEVRRLADEVLQRLPRIDVLVNNVGGYWNTRHVTADGLEHTFALNHLAPFLLTNLLLDRLKQSAPARVVTVASHAHAMGRIDFDDLQGERSYSGARAYNQSKLANVLFTYELARRLRGTSVTANALHPGVVRTSFGAEDPAASSDCSSRSCGRS